MIPEVSTSQTMPLKHDPASHATSFDYDNNVHLGVVNRALPVAPSGYAPASVSCPSARPTIRSAGRLSSEETKWLQTRRNNTVEPMIDLLQRANITGFDASGFINEHRNNPSALPNIGIAVSGGGYRALMNGAGHIAAFDSRTPGSTGTGQLGGLLQSATYLAGLSGGGWLVGSLYTNNFTSVYDIVQNKLGSVWDFQNTIFTGPSQGLPILGEADYYHDIQNNIEAKADTPYGYNISITDYWGRALSYQLVNASLGGPSYTFSSIAKQDFLTNGEAPLPILVADGRAPGETIVSGNATIFEFNPWEMGSWDPTLFGFAPLQYVGSNFSAGKLPNNETCIEGFDNVGYVMGTSSSLFNSFFLEFNDTSIAGKLPSFLKDAVNKVLSGIGQDSNDIADWTPNPFRNFNEKANPNAVSKRLTLVDGGEDLQNIPLNPLIQPFRGLDVIFAIDSSADTPNGYPNATALVATYQRTLNSSIENGTVFPYIPGQQTVVNEGLNARPTFFGCDSSNHTGPKDARTGPLLVYLPNAPYIVSQPSPSPGPTVIALNGKLIDGAYSFKLTSRRLIRNTTYRSATQPSRMHTT